ncbi:MAG: oligosaccharide flippase family protein [Actinomycetota bacterium]|nr:oligosaccharide flippase family protein [Actinomycetota bacterium]
MAGAGDEPEGSRKRKPTDEVLDEVAAGDVRTVTKGGAVQIAGQLSQRGLSSVFTFIAFRILGRVGYGVYREVAQVATIAGQLGLAGFNYASMRWISRARAKGTIGGVKGAASVGLFGIGITSTIVAIAMVVLADPLAEAFDTGDVDESELAGYIRLAAPYVPLFALMQVLRYCTQAYKTMVPSVIAGNIVQPVVRFVIGVAVLGAGLEVAGAVGSLVVSVAAGAIAAGFFFKRMLGEQERAAAPRREVGPMVRFALPQAGASLLGIQTLGVGVIVLGLASGPDQVGIFGLALALQGAGTVFLGGMVNIWAPVVSDLYDRDAIDRLGSLYQTLTRWISTFSLPVYAALILEPDLFAEFGGPEGKGAAPVVAILAIGNVFYSATGPTGYVISMSGHPTVNLMNSVVAVGLYTAIGLPVAEAHGAVGVAVVDAAVTALINSARVLQAWILVGVQPFGPTFYKPVVATISGSAVLLLWRLWPGDSIPLEIGGVVVSAAVFLAVLRAFGLDSEERYVWASIRRRLSRKGSRKIDS